MTNDLLADSLVPIAAELIGTVRDYGPDDVAAVLARVPDGRHDALAVVLAAMVDPDASPGELLAWTCSGPVPSRDGLGFDPHRPLAVCEECGQLMAASSMSRHLGRAHPQGRENPVETVHRVAS